MIFVDDVITKNVSPMVQNNGFTYINKKPQAQRGETNQAVLILLCYLLFL